MEGLLGRREHLETFLGCHALRKIVSTFHKDHPEKPIATSAPLDSAPPMAKPTIKLPAKRKQGQPTGRAKKRIKWGDKEEAIKKK